MAVLEFGDTNSDSGGAKGRLELSVALDMDSLRSWRNLDLSDCVGYVRVGEMGREVKDPILSEEELDFFRGEVIKRESIVAGGEELGKAEGAGGHQRTEGEGALGQR